MPNRRLPRPLGALGQPGGDLVDSVAANGGQPVDGTSTPATKGFAGESDLLTVSDVVNLVGISKQAVNKAVQAGRLQVNPDAPTGRRIILSSVLSAWPQAKAAIETRTAHIEVATRPAATGHDVALRARPETMQRADVVMSARIGFLDGVVRPLLRGASEAELRRANGGLPEPVVVDAIRALTAPERSGMLEGIGGLPSGSTIRRWWRSYCVDPTGASLRPMNAASGRRRLADKIEGLSELVIAAWSHTGSYIGAAQYLQERGHQISDSTVRRHLSRVDQAVLVALRHGERKAMLDHGPYVRRQAARPFACWSCDGHTLDLLVTDHDRMPGEVAKPFRPVAYVVMDVGSGAILACVVTKTLNRYSVLMALAQAMLRTRILPDAIQTDNGSEVKNALFWDKAEDHSYFDALGIQWTLALPYNARSKPIERRNLDIKRRFSARFPTFTGGNPSTRPDSPIQDAIQAGHVLDMRELEGRLEVFRQDEAQHIYSHHGRRIMPIEALKEEAATLQAELGPQHRRFIREGEEYRILPAIPARLVRSAIQVNLEGQQLRYSAPDLVGMAVDGLEARISPWDISRAWLTRGGQLICPLEYLPDAPALGSAVHDVTALRASRNAAKVLRGKVRQALSLRDQIREAEGLHPGRVLAQGHELDQLHHLEQTVISGALTDDQRTAAAEELGRLVQLRPIEPIPITRTEAPSSRRHIRDDLDHALFVHAHPEECDPEEIRQFNRDLVENTTLRTRLELALGRVPNPITLSTGKEKA